MGALSNKTRWIIAILLAVLAHLLIFWKFITPEISQAVITEQAIEIDIEVLQEAPVIEQAPLPQPMPQPVPQPTPQPTPQPVPQPTPQPTPQPIPAPPVPKPIPTPKPKPKSKPAKPRPVVKKPSKPKYRPPTPVAAPSVQSKPKLIRGGRPLYPRIAKKAGREGRALVSFIVNTLGAVQNPRITKSSGYQDLDQAALKSVLRWKFKPAKQKNGVSIPYKVQVPIEFSLR